MSYSRRDLLVSVLPGCAALWSCPTAHGHGVVLIDPSLTEFALRAFRPSVDLARIGAACLDAMGGPASLLSRTTPIRKLHELAVAQGMTTCQLRALVGKAIQTDFANDKVVNVQGMLLSQTEAVCMGLAAMAMEMN